ncbi:MAG: hypothetical protein HY808_09085 [Nitrospirae bacterium]|nr:hypothetical protein [Nitrospirota bacterium]
MSDREAKKAELKKRSQESKQKTDALLSEEIQALQQAASSDLQRLRPKVSDSETYEKLIKAVNEASAKNEGIAELKNRIEKLGEVAVKVGKEVVTLLKSF